MLGHAQRKVDDGQPVEGISPCAVQPHELVDVDTVNGAFPDHSACDLT